MVDVLDLLENEQENFHEFLKDLREQDRRENPFQFQECRDRNVVLIGRSRTGKSTIASVINDILHVSTAAELFSKTSQVEFKTISTETKERIWYHFNFIDVPGFFDMSANESKRKSNHEIKNYLNECMGKDVTNIHMFAFVFNLAAGINERDIETMIFVKTQYPDLSKYMALVITHGEQMTDERKKGLIEQFFAHPKVKNGRLREYFQVGILFMGCLRYESQELVNERSLYFEYKNVLDMRTKFIETCIKCEQPFNFYKPTGSNSGPCSIC